MIEINRRRVSMQDIADELNISKAAVSLALAGKSGVSDDLRNNVITTAVRLGYPIVDKVKRTNNNLLLLLDDGREKDSDFFYAVVSKCLNYAQKKDYNLLVSTVNSETQKQNRIPKVFYDIEAQGVVFAGNIKKNYVQTFLNAKIPCVLMVQHLYGLNVDNIVSANEEGGYELTKHLLGKGHRKIGYFADTSVFDSFSKRLWGYRKALEEAGIETGKYECVFDAAGEVPSEKTISPVMPKVASFYNSHNGGPTAWVAGNDITAVGLINEFRKRGYRVPEDISVVGFDGMPIAKSFHPKITTYDSQIDLLVKFSIDLIIKHIEKAGKIWYPVQISVIGRIIEGESVKVLI